MDKFRTTYDTINKTWSGKPLPAIFHPNANVGQVLLNSLATKPNHIGQISFNNGLQMTNLEIQLNAIRIAQNLKKIGINSGDVVAISASNHHHLASVVFGALSLATPISTMDPAFKTNEILHMLRMTQPKIVICVNDSFHNIQNALSELGLNIPVLLMDQSKDGTKSVNELLFPTGHEQDFEATPLTDGCKQTALIVCSSGTTGLPKGVRISHAMLINHLFMNLDPTSDDTFVTFASLYWISGITTLISPTLSGATRVITTQPFSVELLLEIIAKHRVTVMPITPYRLQLLLQCPATYKADLSSIHRLYVGGASISASIRSQVRQLIPHGTISTSYGLSEVAGMMTVDRSKNSTTTVGHLNRGISVRLVNEMDEFCGPNEDGELLISTEIHFLGYMNDQKATQAAQHSSGWFRSGDIGHFDDDNLLYIVDRKNDFIYTKNGKISPAGVEEVVLSAKGVSEVCVVGLSVLGVEELPAALVIRNNDDYDISETEIFELVKDNFCDRHHLSGGVYFVEEIPKTPSGKVLRREVIKIATGFYHEKQQNRHQRNH